MADKEMIDRAENVFYKTYNRFPVVFDHGEGVYLYDTEGEEYLDFGAGIAVMGLGYGEREFTEAVTAQAKKLCHTSNLFYNAPAVEAGELLLKASAMDKVFFTNSGAEAIEGALKIARRYAYNRDGRQDHEIIAMNHSFHGRTMGALSVTGNAHYQEPFKPMIGGIRFGTFNDLDSVKALVNERTCAVILETVQGEGGIYPAQEAFLKGLRELCDARDMLLILDEIQCGMGRTGHMFAWQGYGVCPDVMTTAKALGNGLPVGAFLARGKAASAMMPGDHGTTYGGNPLAAAGAAAVLKIFEKRRLADHAQRMGEYLAAALERIAGEFDWVKERRGLGLMQGLELSRPAGPVIREALLNQKLVLIGAGASVIRFVPPLIIQEGDVDEMERRLYRAMQAADWA